MVIFQSYAPVPLFVESSRTICCLRVLGLTLWVLFFLCYSVELPPYFLSFPGFFTLFLFFFVLSAVPGSNKCLAFIFNLFFWSSVPLLFFLFMLALVTNRRGHRILSVFISYYPLCYLSFYFVCNMLVFYFQFT